MIDYDDKPKRSTAASYELADVGTRFIALIIDSVILGVIGGILFSSAREPGGAIGFLIGAIYYWYFWTQRDGKTIGNSLMNIRVIKVSGAPLQTGDAVIRYIGYYINSAVFMIGWIWAIFDENKQGWHDKLANTYVVKS